MSELPIPTHSTNSAHDDVDTKANLAPATAEGEGTQLNFVCNNKNTIICMTWFTCKQFNPRLCIKGHVYYVYYTTGSHPLWQFLKTTRGLMWSSFWLKTVTRLLFRGKQLVLTYHDIKRLLSVQLNRHIKKFVISLKPGSKFYPVE